MKQLDPGTSHDAENFTLKHSSAPELFSLLHQFITLLRHYPQTHKNQFGFSQPMDRFLIVRQLSYPQDQRQVTLAADRNIFLMAGVAVERREVYHPCHPPKPILVDDMAYELNCALVSFEFVVVDQFQVHCPCTDPEQQQLLDQIQGAIEPATQLPNDSEPDPSNDLLAFTRCHPTARGLLILHDQEQVPATVLQQIQEQQLDWQPLESLIRVVVPALTKDVDSFQDCVWMQRSQSDPQSPVAFE